MKPFRFLLFTLLAALASCSDGIEDVAPAITSYTGLSLAVPQVTVSSASKTMNATEAECTAKDLYLFCYPQNNDGTFLSQELTGLTAQKDLNGDASLYNIILQPGTYHVYVVANMGDKSIGTDDNGNPKLFKNNYSSLTEDQLKALTLSYDATTLPTAGHIPMVYASGKDVVVYDGKATEVAANLTFTCAKVVVNIIFDPANTDANIKDQRQPNAAEVFKNNINWLLKSVKGNNLTTSTNLFTAPATSGDGALSNVNLPAGSFYDGYDYNEANKDVTNADVVTPKGTAVAKPTNARPWLYRATYYLPERSVTEADKATALPVTGTIKGGKEYSNTYNNISGKNLYPLANGTYKLERGHYYEIVSFVNGLGQYDLPTTVNVEKWTPIEISADFLHTTLWVEKTAASIGSLTKDSVEYTTNAIEGITYGCVTQVDSKDVVSIAKSKDGKKLIFSINPAISMETFKAKGATTGTAKVWIQAGNIKKYIDVNYNVTPFLTVTPQQEVIYWTNDAKEASTLTKVLTFKTNLGGIKFKTGDFTASFDSNKGGSHTFGQSTITVECSSNQVAEGTIIVTATNKPQSTTDHTFTVYPYTDTDGNDKLAQEVKVSVHPPKGYYRIYMRAINDLLNSNENKSNEYQVSWYKAENSNIEKDKNGNPIASGNNWLDGWNCTNSTSADVTKHYVYIYMQKGETSSYSDTENQPIWRFTGTWPGTPLTADVYNPGWYYIEESVTQQSAQGINLDKIPNRDTKEYPDQQTITPGKTLIMFNSNHKDYHVHRFPHHLEPGIPLFNYEDNEGWYLYDPTNEPLYRVFDDKPQVEDITYVFYTPSQVTEWYHYYGISVSNKTSGLTDADMYEIKGTPTSTYDSSTGMYKTTLTFKCAHGYYEKAIKLRGVNGDPVLFYDMPLKPTNGTITGYYYDGSWHVKPKSGAAKRRR